MMDLVIGSSSPSFEYTDVRVSRKAEANSDHYLVVTTLRVKACTSRTIFRPNRQLSILQPGLQKKVRLRIQWLKSQKVEDFEAYRRHRNHLVRQVRSAKQKYLDGQIEKFPTQMAANESKQAFATLKNVLRSTSRNWADIAAPRPSISPKDLKEHYSALFKRRGVKMELPNYSDLKKESVLTMNELFKAKAKLKTGKSPGPCSRNC
ncbi:hypothetical protein ACTXT7_005455 [Hymenolepis weldensis]